MEGVGWWCSGQKKMGGGDGEEGVVLVGRENGLCATDKHARVGRHGRPLLVRKNANQTQIRANNGSQKRPRPFCVSALGSGFLFAYTQTL